MRLLAIALVLLALAGAWLWINPDQATQIKSVLPKNDLTTKTDVIYKWKNNAGEWQMTDSPPPNGIEYERSDYRDDLNVLPVPPGIATD